MQSKPIGKQADSKASRKLCNSYAMQSIRNNTLSAFTINTARSIIVHNLFQCTKETKIRQLLDI